MEDSWTKWFELTEICEDSIVYRNLLILSTILGAISLLLLNLLIPFTKETSIASMDNIWVFFRNWGYFLIFVLSSISGLLCFFTGLGTFKFIQVSEFFYNNRLKTVGMGLLGMIYILVGFSLLTYILTIISIVYFFGVVLINTILKP